MNIASASEWLLSFLAPFFTLSYTTDPPVSPDSFPNSNYYTVGPRDAYFVIGCIAVMAFLRDIFRIFVLEPFAAWYLAPQPNARKSKSNGHANGTTNGVNGTVNGHGNTTKFDTKQTDNTNKKATRRSVLRFAEQGWSMIYYSASWSYGMYIHYNLPAWPFKTDMLWIGYPQFPFSGPLKFFYLVQTSFYLHQILILNAEARRKDHYQMMTHHIITSALLILSYYCNFTRVGCLILVLMDWCDIWFSLAKMFRYMSMTTLCDACFTFFMVSWFITRHALFMLVIKSAHFDGPRIGNFGWDSGNASLVNRTVYSTCVVLLYCLQVLQLIWFAMIVRVAWRVISGQGAEDTRSDDEGDDEQEELAKPVEAGPIPPSPALKKRR